MLSQNQIILFFLAGQTLQTLCNAIKIQCLTKVLQSFSPVICCGKTTLKCWVSSFFFFGLWERECSVGFENTGVELAEQKKQGGIAGAGWVSGQGGRRGR